MINYAQLLEKNSTFQEYLKKLEEKERDRVFCLHDEKHMKEVASLAAWACTVCKVPHEPQAICLAAMLHDLGRAKADKNHEEQSIAMARELLPQIGLPEYLQELVINMIHSHRQKDRRIYGIKTYECLRDEVKQLEETDRILFIFAWADNRVRKCYECKAIDACYWDENRKNFSPIYMEVIEQW